LTKGRKKSIFCWTIIIGFCTDWRWSFEDSKLNQMISGMFDQIFTNELELLKFLKAGA